jgi:hypothetical protein
MPVVVDDLLGCAGHPQGLALEAHPAAPARAQTRHNTHDLVIAKIWSPEQIHTRA